MRCTSQTIATKCCQLFTSLASLLKQFYYLELLLFIHNFAQGLRNSTYFPMIYAKVCQSVYSERSLDQCHYSVPMSSDEKLLISARTATFLMYCDLANFVPNLLTGAYFGAYGDRYGQKVPTVVTLASLVVHTWLYAFLCYSETMPPWTIVLESGLLAIFGGKTVFMASQFSEASRQTKDKNALSERFAIMTASSSLSTFLACMSGALLIKYSTDVKVQMWGEFVLVLCFFVAFFMCADSKDPGLGTSPSYPTVLKALENGTLCSVSIVHISIISTSQILIVQQQKKPPLNQNKLTTCQSFLNRSLKMYNDLWVTLRNPRFGHQRAHLFVLCAIALVYSCVDFGMDRVTTLFVYGHPLQWTVSEYSVWTAVASLVQLAGGLLGLKVMKRFQLSDYTIIVIGLLSAALRMVSLGVASHSWVMYLSVTIGCISSSGLSSLRAVVASLGGPEETGRLVTTVSMVMNWSGLVSCLLFNNVYSATVSFYPGFTFLCIVPLLVLCAGVIVLLQCDSTHSKS